MALGSPPIDANSDFIRRRKQLKGRLDEAESALDEGQRDRVRDSIADPRRTNVRPSSTGRLTPEEAYHADRLFRVLQIATADGLLETRVDELAQLIRDRLFVRGLSSP